MSLSFSPRGNVISDENALQSLRLVSKSLRAFVISENPMVETTDYRLSVMILLPKLERLDKDPVSPEERTEALERIKVTHTHTQKTPYFYFWHGQTKTAPLLIVTMTYVSFQELKEEEISDP